MQLGRPPPIGRIRAQNLLDTLTVGGASGLDPRDRAATTEHDEALSASLDGVEELGEATGGVCRAKRSHQNQIIRFFGSSLRSTNSLHIAQRCSQACKRCSGVVPE